MTEFLGLAYAAYSYMYNVWLRIMVKGVKNNSYTMGDKVNQQIRYKKMLTRDTESATKCTICDSWIDKSWHIISKMICPTCMIKGEKA